MHLSFAELRAKSITTYGERLEGYFAAGIDIDSGIFYHQPSSLFAVDARIPRVIRDLVEEADKAQKLNLLTGASACIRKAIYELVVQEGGSGEHYQDKVKSLKQKFPNVYGGYFDDLATALELTSDQVHEFSSAAFDGQHCKLLLETLRAALHEIYVLPEERMARTKEVQRLREAMKTPEQPTDKS